MNKIYVKELKLNLYRELLNIPRDKISDEEVNIMYELYKDKDIQELFK